MFRLSALLAILLLLASSPASSPQSATAPGVPSRVNVHRTSEMSTLPDVGPIPIYQTEPKYTDEAKRHNVTGSVILRADVGADGKLDNIVVERGLGFGLDESAIECVKSWRFQPARKNWVPYSRPIFIEVAFPPHPSEADNRNESNVPGASAHSSGMKVYTDYGRAFSFEYPSTFQVTVRGRDPLGSECIACIAYDRKLYESTDFAGAYFWVDIPSQPAANESFTAEPIRTESDCVRFRGLDNIQQLPAERLHGVTFTRVTYGGVAAGTASQVELLRAFHDGKCYEIGFDISTIIGGYDKQDYSSGRVKHFAQSEERKVQQALQQVVQTFRFLR